MSEGLPLYSAFLNWLSRRGEITVPTEFHDRCEKIRQMLDNDVTGVINTILDYAINSASDTKYKIECPDDATEELLNEWMNQININIDGVPSGIQELAREYLRERWQGSSFCLLRVSNWKKITIGVNTITAPTVLWFVNGSSIYISRNTKNFELGSDKYYLDKELIKQIPTNKEQIVIHKPFDRWYSAYSTPYAIRKGIYKNAKAIEVLQTKGDEVISKVMPYLLMLLKGSPEMTKAGTTFEESDLKELGDAFQTQMQKYDNQGGKTPTWATGYDTKLEHVIPDIKNMLTEELFRQSYRALMSGLGFIEIMSENNRKASVINPKPFIAELNSGISGFKTVLLDVLNLVIKENKIDHKKLFSANNELHIVNTQLKINIESILDQIRSSFTYGVTSIQTYQESLGLDPVIERERIFKEWENGDRDKFYARLIQNQEANPNIGDKPTSVPQTKKQNEKQNEKTKNTQNMQKASEEVETIDSEKVDLQNKVIELEKESETQKAKIKEQEELADQILKLQKAEILGKQGRLLTKLLSQSEDNIEKAPYTKEKHPSYLDQYPSDAVDEWIRIFNENLPKGESYAFPLAWTIMKKYLKKHYKKAEDKWVKK